MFIVKLMEELTNKIITNIIIINFALFINIFYLIKIYNFNSNLEKFKYWNSINILKYEITNLSIYNLS